MLETSRRFCRFRPGCWGIGVGVKAPAHRAVATPRGWKGSVLEREPAEVTPFVGTNPVATDGICVMAYPTAAKHLRDALKPTAYWYGALALLQAARPANGPPHGPIARLDAARQPHPAHT